ncbi:MAG: ribonuclease H-like domain-containing protein [Planctomycetota bacterium]
MSQWKTTEGDPTDLVQVERLEGSFSAREQRIKLLTSEEEASKPEASTSFYHGEWALDEVDAADATVIARIARDPELESIDLRDAIFLDTETSGLSGGAGVYVYMVGLGFFEGDSYVSWQSFLRHPGEERAMLAEVADRIRGRSAVVSFFGKSFDRHRLEDKMRIAGVEPPFEGRPHLDLYHPFRRLTQGQLPNGRLQTMERALLGFQRERDLPGSLAPAAWFDYLAGRPHLLEGVFQHNHEDVLSLVSLSAYLGRVEEENRRCGAPLRGHAPRRAAALAETAVSAEARLRWAETALARSVEGADRRRMQLLVADHHRRTGAVDAARAAYREALEECADDRLAIDLFVGASMLLEHSVGDLPHARGFAQRALSLGEDKRLAKGQLYALRRRVERLALKTAERSGGPAPDVS